jgi:1-acyl-sn-glycerol-3-phosphate acyltransferase
MLRTIWTALVAIAVTIPVSTAVIGFTLFTSTSKTVDRMIRWWARRIVRAAGIDLHVENSERIEAGQRYILVSNHYSYLDIPCILAGISQQPIRFLAKKSLFSIPIFGWALGRSGFVPIDRKNRRTAVKSFELAAERIRKGNTIVVFPEEGRTRTRELRPFQRGGFLLALKSGLPVIPIAIDSTFDVLPVGAKRIVPGRVTLRVGTPIATEARSVREKESLAAASREQIEAMLVRAKPELPSTHV